MTLRELAGLIEAEIIYGEQHLDDEFECVSASDLMSDILAFGMPGGVMLTGLANAQSIRTAEIIEAKAIVYVRGKKPGEEGIKLARERDIPILSTRLLMYKACGLIYRQEEKQAEKVSHESTGGTVSRHDLSRAYEITGRNFAKAGSVSVEIKQILQELGIDPAIVRRAAIAAYETEMNVVMYADRGEMVLRLNPRAIQITLEDSGPGIENIEMAMQEGYSTASDEIREMGFGAGMGLHNIKKNADVFELRSTVGEGTSYNIVIYLDSTEKT